MLIADADLGAGRPERIRIHDGRITDVGPGLPPRPGEAEYDAAGRVVIPGLHDHHVHLYALAAARESVVLGPPQVTTLAGFSAALRAAAGEGRLRGIGYHESVAGRLDRWRLDAIVPDRPFRVQHRTGVEWTLNSAAVRDLGVAETDHPGVERRADGTPTGRLTRMDDWLAARPPPRPLDLGGVGRDALRRGIVAFTDATPLRDPARVAALPQRLTYMTAPDQPDAGWPAGRGPVKVILDDDRLPGLDELTGTIRRAHAAGRAVAVHCVTRTQTVLTVAALRAAGTGGRDRIEHGSVIPRELFADVRDLGVTVVTNPGFVAARGDAYLRDVDDTDLADLYRCGSLVRAGIRVLAGTDAPYGPADPWVSIAAAVDRTTPAGATLGAAERLSRPDAIGLFTAGRRVAAGHPGDLCVLAADPAAPVAATVIGGRVYEHAH